MDDIVEERSDLEIIEEDDKEQTHIWSNTGPNSVKRRSMDTPGENIISNRASPQMNDRNDDDMDIISKPDGEEGRSMANLSNKQSTALLRYNGEEDDID